MARYTAIGLNNGQPKIIAETANELVQKIRNIQPISDPYTVFQVKQRQEGGRTTDEFILETSGEEVYRGYSDTHQYNFRKERK